jgi:medium-chain acyl-[acyl-carrier-protein] hydrolase
MNASVTHGSIRRWGKERRRPALNLVCFPHAGGCASLFRDWADVLPEDINLLAVQLPGREDRWGEPPHTEVRPLVAEVAADLAPYLDRPFAVFGHSLGALLAFEVCCHLEKNQSQAPVSLFASAAPTPSSRKRTRRFHLLPDAQLVSELHKMGGIPHTILKNPELLLLMLPTLRADFKLYETQMRPSGEVLGAPIMAFGGALDRQVSWVDLQGWRRHTVRYLGARMFPGGHFFIHQNRDHLLRVITAALHRRPRSATLVKGNR